MNAKGRENRIEEFKQCLDDAEKILESKEIELDKDKIVLVAVALWNGRPQRF